MTLGVQSGLPDPEDSVLTRINVGGALEAQTGSCIELGQGANL
jgi:hypothetical protein